MHTRRVLLSGDSIYLAVIESSLRLLPDVELASEEIDQLEPYPDVVILACRAPDPRLALPFLQRMQTGAVILIDVQTNTLRKISVGTQPVQTIDDLLEVVMPRRPLTPPPDE